MSFTAGAGTRFVVTSTASQSSGTVLTGPITATAGTATTDTPAFNITQTWNNAAVTFTGLRFNVTDTASNASSLLMDLQVGGVSRFRVDKNGKIVVNANSSVFGANSNQNVQNWSGSIALQGYSLSFGAAGSGPDVFLDRDAANTLAQRNSTNAQTFRVYGTFTDASNYERGRFAWVSNVLTIGTENAGTGLARNLTIESAGGGISFSSSASIQLQVNGRAFISHAAGASTLNFGGVTAGPANIDTIAIFTNNAQRWTFNNSGHFVAFVDNTYDIGATGASRPRNVFWAGYQEMSEMTAPAAPAANSVRIYAEDNGSGKTRLMALFATGAAQQIAIEP